MQLYQTSISYYNMYTMDGINTCKGNILAWKELAKLLNAERNTSILSYVAMTNAHTDHLPLS